MRSKLSMAVRFAAKPLPLIALLGFLGLASLASGVSEYGGSLDYYSDGSFTELVGGRWWFCGSQGSWGTRTAYKEITDFYRCDGAFPVCQSTWVPCCGPDDAYLTCCEVPNC